MKTIAVFLLVGLAVLVAIWVAGGIQPEPSIDISEVKVVVTDQLVVDATRVDDTVQIDIGSYRIWVSPVAEEPVTVTVTSR